MTAKDSRSTPKKAERHPLALLNPYLMDGESEQEMLMHRAWQEGHDAALRAQAEATPLHGASPRGPEARHDNNHDALSHGALPAGRAKPLQQHTRTERSGEQAHEEHPIFSIHASVSPQHLHALALSARDARTSADRRAALDALERAALALGGTP